MSKKFLTQKRRQIDDIDKNILLLLKKRLKVLREIKKIKKELDLSIYDKKRESTLLKRAQAISKKSLDKKTILGIYKAIISQSLDFISKV